MSSLYYPALTITVVLGAILIMVYVTDHSEELREAFTDLSHWLSRNRVSILAFFFSLSLLVTVLARIGIF